MEKEKEMKMKMEKGKEMRAVRSFYKVVKGTTPPGGGAHWGASPVVSWFFGVLEGFLAGELRKKGKRQRKVKLWPVEGFEGSFSCMAEFEKKKRLADRGVVTRFVLRAMS